MKDDVFEKLSKNVSSAKKVEYFGHVVCQEVIMLFEQDKGNYGMAFTNEQGTASVIHGAFERL